MKYSTEATLVYWFTKDYKKYLKNLTKSCFFYIYFISLGIKDVRLYLPKTDMLCQHRKTPKNYPL